MDNRAVSPVIGVILMVAIAVVLAAVLWITLGGQSDIEASPQVAARENGDTIQIIAVQNGPIDWADVDVTGCTGIPTGTVSGGDTLTGCSGRVTIVHGGVLLYESG